MKTSGPPKLIISGALFLSAMVIFHLDGEIWPGA
jgi:hypothetical protein